MSKINIIYLIPELKIPTGGAKVIYNHSYILIHIKAIIVKIRENLTKNIPMRCNNYF